MVFLNFKPAKHLIKQGECLRFIVSLAEDYKRTAPLESGLVHVIMKTDRSFQRYNNLEELRNARLLGQVQQCLQESFRRLHCSYNWKILSENEVLI